LEVELKTAGTLRPLLEFNGALLYEDLSLKWVMGSGHILPQQGTSLKIYSTH